MQDKQHNHAISRTKKPQTLHLNRRSHTNTALPPLHQGEHAPGVGSVQPWKHPDAQGSWQCRHACRITGLADIDSQQRLQRALQQGQLLVRAHFVACAAAQSLQGSVHLRRQAHLQRWLLSPVYATDAEALFLLPSPTGQHAATKAWATATISLSRSGQSPADLPCA